MDQKTHRIQHHEESFVRTNSFRPIDWILALSNKQWDWKSLKRKAILDSAKQAVVENRFITSKLDFSGHKSQENLLKSDFEAQTWETLKLTVMNSTPN